MPPFVERLPLLARNDAFLMRATSDDATPIRRRFGTEDSWVLCANGPHR
jgi:hypothetical protein